MVHVSLKNTLISILLTFISLAIDAQTGKADLFATESITIPEDSTATIFSWFKAIEERGITLSYNSKNVNLEEKIKLLKQKLSIQDFLNAILCNYEFNAEFSASNKILIQLKGVKTFTFKGYIYDKENKEPLPECTVFVESKNKQGRFYAVTDSSGCFSIKLPFDKYLIKVSYIGYQIFMKEVLLNRNAYLDIRMYPFSFSLPEIHIKTSTLLDVPNYKGATSLLSLNDNDPFAQIHSLPGITGTSVNGDMHVNGGHNDENLILLDGIPIYHSHHNNTLLAQFNGDIVKKISYYDSFIPAKYEGRLSSVTDVTIKEGDSINHHQTLGLELPSASLTLDGPIIRNKLTYIISGRHSWIDFMKDLFTEGFSSRSFNDLMCKLCYTANSRLSIQGLLYRSNDRYNDSISIYKNHKILEWRNNLYSLSCQIRLPGGFLNSNIISFTEYKNSIFAPAISIPSSFYINEGMKNMKFISDFSKKLDLYVDLSFGVSMARERFNLLTRQTSIENTFQKISKLSFYMNAKMKMTERLHSSVALNMVSYLPENNEKYFSIQPRFTIQFIPDEKNTLFFDFSRMEQFYHNICEGEIPIPSDFRMPSIKGFKPCSSIYGELGWRHLNESSRTGVVLFYKRRFRILGLKYNMSEDFNESWNYLIKQGNAQSYGIKMHGIIQWNKWKVYSSYTFSKSQEWFKEYDNNRKNPALHDIPHVFHCAVSYQTGKRTYLTMGGYIQSGGLLDVYYVDNHSPVSLHTHREREKSNFRFDINYSGKTTSNHERLRLSYKFGLYNIIGNPKEKEIIDLYSMETRYHCLPYFTLNVKF